MKLGIIYLAHNTINNQVYIGQTIQGLDVRTSGHHNKAKNRPSTHFHKSIKYYGESAFEWSILEELPVDELNDAEIFWISYFKYIGATLYNHTNGGKATRGYKHTEETKHKISEANKGKPSPAKSKPGSNLGKTFSNEHRKKISESLKGVQRSDEWRNKQSIAQKGRFRAGHPMAEESRRRLSEAKKGKPAHNKGKRMSDEQRQKLSASMKGRTAHNKGKPMSDEQKRKLMEGNKRYWEDRRKGIGDADIDTT